MKLTIQQAFDQLTIHVDLVLRGNAVYIEDTFPCKNAATPVVASIAKYFLKKCSTEVPVHYSYTGPKFEKVRAQFTGS